jgi:hypothetical protein
MMPRAVDADERALSVRGPAQRLSPGGTEPAPLGAHARLPRHFLTKSQRYSTTFRAIRAERRVWWLREDLAAIDRDTGDPNDIPIDVTIVVVINDWQAIHFGHRDDAERELAAAIPERNRQQRHSRIQQRSAA